MDGPWKSAVANSSLNGYLKLARPLREDGSASIALVGDYTFQRMESSFGANGYDALQHSSFVNLIYRNQFSESHDFTAGINAVADWWNESIMAPGAYLSGAETKCLQWAPYAEYTFKKEEKFSAIAGLSGVFLGGEGFRPVPRLTLKYQLFDNLILRANAGRGLRRANPIVDNIGILSTGKLLSGMWTDRLTEDSWTFGGNATLYFSERTSLSLDFFRTDFTQQLLLDRESPASITMYYLDGHQSRSDNYQADFSTEPIERLSFTITARYTDARFWHPDGGLLEVPMSSCFKGVFNAQYKTRLSKWIFDFTASVNGSARVYGFMEKLADADGRLLYPEGRTPVYPLLYAQITRRFRGFDIYAGGENLGGFTQTMPIINADSPFSPSFDAASVWGPLMGARIYAGFRITIWK